MMKVLVAYYSETGNTEKVARAIHEEALKKHESHFKRINEVAAGEIGDYDVVFLGSPCHSANLASPVRSLLRSLPKSPKFKLAGFFTHSVVSPERLPDARDSFNTWAGRCVSSFENTSKRKKIEFLGCYNCEGVPSPPVQEFIRSNVFQNESAEAWQEYIEEAATHPDDQDLRRAQEFTRTMLSKL